MIQFSEKLCFRIVLEAEVFQIVLVFRNSSLISLMSLTLPPSSPSSEKEGLDSPPASVKDNTFTYTPEEERRVYWKLNLTLLPLLFLGFYVFQLERGNISNALTDGLVVSCSR
jgi:hypothetical protein